MAIKYSFVDNATYGTDDINAITKDLTGAGIAPFPVQDTYNTSDLNALTAALTASGTSLEGCKCTVSNAATANMTVTVAQGIVFFESGVRLTVDSDRYVISVTPNTAGYVFAHYKPSLQTADIVFDTETPTDGEYVLLAELAANGTITDRRSFARSKVATFGANALHHTLFTVLETPVFEGIDDYNRKIVVTRRLESIDLSKFNYAFISFLDSRGWFDLKTGKFVVRYMVNSFGGAAGDAACETTMLVSAGNVPGIEIVKTDNTLVAKQISGYTEDVYADRPMTVILT